MPLTHSRTLRVRHYECDAYGHVNNANYVRYMQETAFDASAAAGYGIARYEAMGRIWLVRDTDIEYLQPLRYGDSVTITTWVADMRKVRSQRAYEFRNDATQELAARAHTDWVFLDIATGRPAPIPEELMAAFFPEGVPTGVPPREHFPTPPPPPTGVFSMPRIVEWRDIDPMQHVNNATYLAYMDDCGVQVSRAHGWSMERMASEGFGIVTRRNRIDYRQPALLDDDLIIATWVSGVRSSSATRHYTITRANDDALLAQANAQYVWVDLTSRKLIRIPEYFLRDFADNIVD